MLKNDWHLADILSIKSLLGKVNSNKSQYDKGKNTNATNAYREKCEVYTLDSKSYFIELL